MRKFSRPMCFSMNRPTPIAVALCAGLLLQGAPVSAVGTQRVELKQGDDFKGGELQGVSVDSNGRLRAGFNLGNIPMNDAATVWSSLLLRDGSLLIGTGNEGKLFKHAGGTTTLLAESPGLTLSTLAQAWNGTIVAGAIASGSLFKVQGNKFTEFAKLPGASNVYSSAYDADAQVLYVGTGPEGKVFRVTANGDPQVYFDADEQHIMSLAMGRGGRLYAGASDKAKLYEISAAGRGNVLYDFGRTEVRAIAVAAQGDIYAIANEIKIEGRATNRRPPDKESAAPVAIGTPAKGAGTLYRFSASGLPEQLLDDKDEHYVSLALGSDGRPYVGTGVEGRVYTVDAAHTEILIADTPERQVTALALTGAPGKGVGGFVLSSDPAVIHPVKGVGGADALWTSKALDLQLRARFGTISWLGNGALEISTRTGNSAEPDKTWSDWSAPLVEAGLVTSPAARYIQVRARFNKDPNAELSDITIPFVLDNMGHVVTSVQIEQSAGDGVAELGKVKSSGGPVTKQADQKVGLKWNVDNPDKDELQYKLQYRVVGSTDWYDVLKPGERVTKESYSWDTAALPEGRYRVRITAADDLSNPPAQVTRHSLESSIVIIDNTAPALLELRAEGRKIKAIAVDGVGPVARFEVAIAGRDDWFPFHSVDGVFDEQREELEADVTSFVPAGPALLSIRVYDQEGNVAVRSVTVK
jgi:hypothetical protein